MRIPLSDDTERSGAETAGEAAAPSPPKKRLAWHTRRFLIVFYALAVAFGVLDPADESDLAFLQSVGVSFSLAWWTITDASDRGRPLRMSVRVLVIFLGWLAAPIYVLCTRRLRGLAWVLLNGFAFVALNVAAFWLPRLLIGEALRL